MDFIELHFPKKAEGTYSSGKFNVYKKLFIELFNGEVFDFKCFFSGMCDGQGYRGSEIINVELPASLIEDNLYEGQVEIYINLFDGLEHLENVELKSFFTKVKEFALFYRDHVDKKFDPVPHFFKLDKIVEQYNETTYSDISE